MFRDLSQGPSGKRAVLESIFLQALLRQYGVQVVRAEQSLAAGSSAFYRRD
ncbi:hypothetical protein ACQW02_13005 [Humitalea sp. 24SJ18S-53]|uniref:hypothetical protein n=1 Tax=Humitalea sp. 24SJ18S-53 TaxID=3422307 RepID=UPI003D678DD3